jgi:Cys-tRNA(Pro) deacylase
MADSPQDQNTPVTQELSSREIPFQFFRHPGKVSSLEQAAAERGQRPQQVVRSILFRLTETEYVLALVAGPQQISWAALRKYLGKSRLTMATPEEVKKITGYETGSVSPFGLPQPIRILVDESVLREKVISLGSGRKNTAVIMSSADLIKALEKPEIVRLIPD